MKRYFMKLIEYMELEISSLQHQLSTYSSASKIEVIPNDQVPKGEAWLVPRRGLEFDDACEVNGAYYKVIERNRALDTVLLKRIC